MRKIEFAHVEDYNIYRLLKKNKKKWLYAYEIIKAVGMKNTRSIRTNIHRLRRMGIPIASDVSKGYRYVTDYKDIQPTIRWFRMKSFDHSRTAQALELIFIREQQHRLF